jgi:hypothetical protein
MNAMAEVSYTDEVRDAALARLRDIFGGKPDDELVARARAFATSSAPTE